MLRVAGLAAAGGGVPFLLYAAIHNPSKADERVVGLLSIGILGAYVGFRLTRDLDVDQDVKPGEKKDAADDAPVAVVGRSSNGRWGLGMLGVTPLSRSLAPQPGSPCRSSARHGSSGPAHAEHERAAEANVLVVREADALEPRAQLVRLEAADARGARREATEQRRGFANVEPM